MQKEAGKARGGGTQGVQSVEIAARILSCFTAGEPVLGVTQIGERLRMPKSKVHRFLVSLQRVGLVRRDPTTDRYSLGLKLFELGQVAVSGLDVLAQAGSAVRRLAQEAGHTVSVAIWTNEGPALSHVTAPPGLMSVGYGVGAVVSLHASAHGKVHLAHQPPDYEDMIVFGTLTPLTRKTITDPQLLRAQLERVRTEGIAISRGESALGVFEVSSPVFGITGRLAASLGMVGLGDEIAAPRERELARRVQTAALALSAELGYVTPDTAAAFLPAAIAQDGHQPSTPRRRGA